MHPVIRFEDVSKKFRRGESHNSLRDLIPALVSGAFKRRPSEELGVREFWALRNVSFEVAQGEALGIIGANGAGKSTTLKVLTKILKPTTGRCSIEGRVGALIEVAAGFHPDLTGRENVFLQGAIMGMKRAEIAKRFDAIIEFAGVGEFIDTPVKRYSSGMSARLGFSIAAHLNPDALVIDEILSVGDLTFQQKCFERMLAFKREGMSIVLVSHNLQAVANLCDRTVYLAGSVQAAGPTIEVLEAYVRTSQKPQLTADVGSVQIESIALLVANDSSGTHRDVSPGTELTLRVEAKGSQPLDDVIFGFQIHRSTDQLAVYDGTINCRELGEPTSFVGEFAVDLKFRAHLVRGHYYISLFIFDNYTHTYHIRPRQVATLGIREMRSRAGIADLELSGRLANVTQGEPRA
jgi:homopolymeric O-antigen transport system ATP-binding protein